MPAIILEGNGLSERHHKLNAGVNEAYKNKLLIDDVLSPNESTDVDNIFRIDLASKYRNVDYIIENFKSTDSLNVARALKAQWLFTDNQYSHIINPIYINTTLSPLISDKTLNQLLYKITYHLNDEKRCEEFYVFYQQSRNKNYLKKFLPKCSVAFIKERIKMKDFDITPEYLSLLSFKSWEIVATFVDLQVDKKISSEYIWMLKHLLNVNGDFYLDLVENNVQVCNRYSYSYSYLGQRVTREIVRNHKSRIFAKPQFYLKLLHFNHLTRALTKDEIRNLATLITSRYNFWSNDLLKSLLNKLPLENRYDFIRSVYVKYHPDDSFEMNYKFTEERWYKYTSVKQQEEWALEHVARMDEYLGQVFQWYQFVNFKITFVEMKKLLKVETEAYYRQKMFDILVSTCSNEESDIFELLKYFHDRHINEIMSFKINIIERIIQSKNIYSYGDQVWNILNEILLNLRIYESVNECSWSFKQKAVSHVLAHHIINNKPIENKVLILFDDHYSKLDMMINTQWNDKVFEFLYKWNLQKIEEQDLETSKSLEYVKNRTHELIRLTVSYGHQPRPEIFSLVRRIQEYDPKFVPEHRYKEMFEEFFSNEPVLPELDEDICLHLLKKDIKRLDVYKAQFDNGINNDTMRYRKFLRNIRIYFGNDFALDWRKYLLDKFEKNRKDSKGCACVLFGLSILLPATEYEQFIKEYQPAKVKLVWSEADPCRVHIQNNIGKFMYLVRPTVNIDCLTPFAKGDFLQYTIQSLASVSRQLPREECRKFVMKLLAERVSVRKHGIRMAFTKYTKFELLEMFREMWAKTANVSIQKLLFNNIHKLLTEADNDEIRLEVWKLLKVILGQLRGNENVVNIITMTDSENIGTSVKPQYCTEYWHVLDTAPKIYQSWAYKSANQREMAHHDVINLFDEEFLKKIIINFLHDQFPKPTIEKKEIPRFYFDSGWTLISQYLVLCQSGEIAERRKEFLNITIRNIFSNWTVDKTQEVFHTFLKKVLEASQAALHKDKADIFNPVYIFEHIYTEMNKLFSKQDYYEHHLWLKLAIIFINSLYETRVLKPDSFEMQCRFWAEIFGSHIKVFMNVEIADNYCLLPQLFRHYFFKFLDVELTGHYSHNKEKFYNGICKSLMSDEADIYSTNLAVECLIKVKLPWRKIDADLQEADTLIETLRKLNIPYLNNFIDTRISSYSYVFR